MQSDVMQYNTYIYIIIIIHVELWNIKYKKNNYVSYVMYIFYILYFTIIILYDFNFIFVHRINLFNEFVFLIINYIFFNISYFPACSWLNISFIIK